MGGQGYFLWILQVMDDIFLIVQIVDGYYSVELGVDWPEDGLLIEINAVYSYWSAGDCATFSVVGDDKLFFLDETLKRLF